MKFATIFLILMTLYSLIPQKTTQPIPLLETEISVIVTGTGVEHQELLVHPNSKIKDIINLVNLHENADTSRLNLNEYVYRDMVITINQEVAQSCISINSADIDLLITLSGIGEITAQKIIEYRNQRPFILLEDIMNVDSIGTKKFEKIKDQICL